jgi:hypothetical protein
MRSTKIQSWQAIKRSCKLKVILEKCICILSGILKNKKGGDFPTFFNISFIQKLQRLISGIVYQKNQIKIFKIERKLNYNSITQFLAKIVKKTLDEPKLKYVKINNVRRTMMFEVKFLREAYR